MKQIDIGQTIQILANIGVLAGIVFLGYELRQNTLATEIASAQNVITNIGAMNKIVVESDEFADMLLRAEEGADLTPTERIRLAIFYTDALRGWQSIHFQYERGALDEVLWHTQREEMARTLGAYSIFREHWRQRQHFYAASFNDLMAQLIQGHVEKTE